tara:strand:- start:1148 stop:1408 length:261 start_codon:yes stop_codon:yes gene_type:complete
MILMFIIIFSLLGLGIYLFRDFNNEGTGVILIIVSVILFIGVVTTCNEINELEEHYNYYKNNYIELGDTDLRSYESWKSRRSYIKG